MVHATSSKTRNRRIPIPALIVVVGLAITMLTNTPLGFAETAKPEAPKAKHSEKIQSGVPEGFEDLVDPDQPFSSGLADGAVLVGIRERGRQIGDAVARLEADRLVFENPQTVIAMLSNLQNEQRLVERLTSGVDLTSPQVCVIGSVENCETPPPRSLGFLFDPNRLELEILRPENMFRPPAPIAPSHGDDIGAILSFNTRLSGYNADESSDLNGSVSFRAIAGRGRDSAFANGALTSQGDVQVYETGVQTFRGQRRYAAGIFRAGASEVAPQQDIVGVQVESLAQLRPQSLTTTSTPLTILLPRDGYVDVLRGGEILYSGYHEAGSHEISTRAFPTGAYNVTLRIRDKDGASREETRFFSRSTGRSSDTASWSLVAGRTRSPDAFIGSDDDARREGLFYSALQFQKPVAGRFLTRNTIGVLDKTPFVDTQISFPLAGAQASSTLRWSPESYGVAARISGRLEETSISAGLRYVETTSSEDGVGASLTGYNGRQLHYDLSLSRPLPGVGGSANLYVRRFERDSDTRAQQTTSIAGGWNRAFDVGPARAVFSLGAQTDGDHSDAFIGLRFSRQSDNRTFSGSARFRGGWNNDREERSLQYSANASKRSKPRANTQWRANIRMRGDEEALEQVGIGGRLSTNAFNANARMDVNPDDDRLNYAGGFQTALALSPKGRGFSSKTNMQSGVIVTAPSNAPNLTVRASGISGERRLGGDGLFLPLRTFKTATLRARPATSNTAVGGFSPVEIRAFPGNIVHIHADVVRETSVFGRILNADGAPLTNAIASVGDVKFPVDPEGYFVADLSTKAEEIIFRGKDGSNCTLPIDLSSEASIIDLGSRICAARRSSQDRPPERLEGAAAHARSR